MAKPSGAALRKIGGTERPPAPRSAVGDAITSHLRALQAQRGQALEVESVVLGLVPAVAALAERELLVSISVTRDGRAVRLSAYVNKEWIEWFSDDHEAAGDLAAAIVNVLSD